MSNIDDIRVIADKITNAPLKKSIKKETVGGGFSLVADALESNKTTPVGWFLNETALNAAFPTASIGAIAYVGTLGVPASSYIYNYQSSGWVNTGNRPTGSSVDLSLYSQKGGSSLTMQQMDDKKANIVDLPHTGGDTVKINTDDLSTYNSALGIWDKYIIYDFDHTQITEECVLKSISLRASDGSLVVYPAIIMRDETGLYVEIYAYSDIDIAPNTVQTFAISDNHVIPVGAYLALYVADSPYYKVSSGMRSAVVDVDGEINYQQDMAFAFSYTVENKLKVADDILTESVADGKYIQGAVDDVTYNGETAELTVSHSDGASTVINLPKENFLSDAVFDPETNMLTLTLVDGTTFSIDLVDLIDVYTASDNGGLVVSGNAFGIKLDPTGTPGVLTLSANGLKIDLSAYATVTALTMLNENKADKTDTNGDKVVYTDIDNSVYGDIIVKDTDRFIPSDLLALLQSYGLEITPANFFARNAIKEGATVDAGLLASGYNALNPLLISDASVVLIPGAYKSGVVYGLNPRTGEAVNFDFSRATSATYFDNNLDMHLVLADIPRLDYRNIPKVLVERLATNVLTQSQLLSNWTKANVSVENTDILCKNFANYQKITKTTTSNNANITSVRILTEGSASAVIRIKKGNTSQCGIGIHSDVNGFGTPNYELIEGNATIALLSSRVNVTLISDEVTVRVYRTDIPSSNIALLIYPDFQSSTTLGAYVYATMAQIELTGYSTSYIPTTTAQVTRSSDNLSYALENDCSVYLKTTKQNIVLDKSAGQWDIQNDLDNDGIIQLAIFDRILTADEKAQLTA